MIVVSVVAAPVVVLGAVLVNVIGVPFRSPVTTALESAPREELKSELILSTNFRITLAGGESVHLGRFCIQCCCSLCDDGSRPTAD